MLGDNFSIIRDSCALNFSSCSRSPKTSRSARAKRQLEVFRSAKDAALCEVIQAGGGRGGGDVRVHPKLDEDSGSQCNK